MISISLLGIKDNVEKLKEADRIGADFVHLDVMDGKFVDYTSDMQLLGEYQTPRDVHLMVYDIEKYVDIYQKYHPDFITFHAEATDDIEKHIHMIHELGIKVGLAIKPSTSVYDIEKYLPMIDLVLVMTVEPGRGGQKLIPEMKEKVELLYQLREQHHFSYLIEVDGGVNIKTIPIVEKADIFVVGSYITDSEDMAEKLHSIM